MDNHTPVEGNQHAVPTCVGIIMDGNRRWARERGLATLEGHRQGDERLKDVMKWIREAGIVNIILYAFSTENWRRGAEEQSYLMNLFRAGIRDRLKELEREHIRVRFIGERERFPADIQEQMSVVEEKSKQFTDATLGIALSYGGRAELVEAIKNLTPEDVVTLTEDGLSHHLWTAGMP